jgi:predicted transposase YbfD/YdcC
VDAATPLSILHHFRELPDPRLSRNCRHELLDILVITVCAVIANADSWTDIETYGQAKHDWLHTFLRLPNGIPSHDCFRRVLSALDPLAFQRCFGHWIEALSSATDLKHYAIDGKTLRQAFDRTDGKVALHLVSAWATANQLSLGQVAVDHKSNEITAIPRLLELLHLSGAIVTIDAMGCQKEIARQLREADADYVLAVKDNQPRLLEDIRETFAQHLEKPLADPNTFQETVDHGHGRHEKRSYCLVTDLEKIRDRLLWPDLHVLCMVMSERTVNGETSVEARYYIGSRQAGVATYVPVIRGHWGIENSLHWILDVTFGEDDQRAGTKHGAENLAWVRRMAVSLMKNDKSSKESLHAKRLKAGWDDHFLLQLLAGVASKEDHA